MEEVIYQGMDFFVSSIGSALVMAICVLNRSLLTDFLAWCLRSHLRPGVWRSLIVILSISGLSVGTFWVFRNVEFPLPRTMFAPNYSRVAFNRIRVGDKADMVYRSLGKPITSRNVELLVRHHFPSHNITLDCAYGGQIVAWSDPKGILPKEELQSGQYTPGYFEEEIGRPSKVEVLEERSVLFYSRPWPPWELGWHWQRMIFLDSGKVVRKRSGLYVDL